MKLTVNLLIGDLLEEHAFLDDWFREKNLNIQESAQLNLSEFTTKNQLDFQEFTSELDEFISSMKSFLGIEDESTLHSIEILPGTDKSGNPENFQSLYLKLGDILTIVGPTGSGKSRLLADIEWMAQGDTPTGRTVLINGEKPSAEFRFGGGTHIVAQLSQNMNFVMDLSVREFLDLHASSRNLKNRKEIVERVLIESNQLAGEKFDPETPITSLSGGQSRALMIADTAILSQSPIVLIDEIENAGIQRKKALELLVGESKIVLMATHDPVLALMGEKRIVIANGGIAKMLTTTDKERQVLTQLELMDEKIQKVRQQLRQAQPISLEMA